MADRPGFMIYADDWITYSADYAPEEIGQMINALLAYFMTGEHTEFSDRGMRQFYRQATKAIDYDGARYIKKCEDNAYHRYTGICKQKGQTPLSREEWDERRISTDVNARQRTLTKMTNNQPPAVSIQPPSPRNQPSAATGKGI